jgi:hypothetical protein
MWGTAIASTRIQVSLAYFQTMFKGNISKEKRIMQDLETCQVIRKLGNGAFIYFGASILDGAALMLIWYTDS